MKSIGFFSSTKKVDRLAGIISYEEVLALCVGLQYQTINMLGRSSCFIVCFVQIRVEWL
jgi:hypothetical protein